MYSGGAKPICVEAYPKFDIVRAQVVLDRTPSVCVFELGRLNAVDRLLNVGQLVVGQFTGDKILIAYSVHGPYF